MLHRRRRSRFLALVLLGRTQWGRWIYAVGGNPDARPTRGHPDRARARSRPTSCADSLAGVAAILVAGRIDAASPQAGQLLELDSIAAVIIGGASFPGGRGSVWNVLVGALTIGVIRNGLDLLGVDALLAADRDRGRRSARGRGRCRPRLRRGARASGPGNEADVSVSEQAEPVTKLSAAPAVTVRGATKRFGAVTALESVDLDLYRGEVLALLGDNGAGKSTLIKCLSGVHRLDAGTITMDGRHVAMHAPADARALGVETVYQDLALFDNLGPTDNFYAGRELAGPRGAAAPCAS